MEQIILYVITFLILLTREYFSFKERNAWQDERQKLLDRVQSKDFLEFKKYEEVKEVPEEKEEKPIYDYL
jgi:hypothetical protein